MYNIYITNNEGYACGLIKESITCYDNTRDCTKCPLYKQNKCLISDNRVLLCNVSYILPDGYILYIKSGFIYDGASIPKKLLGLVGGGKYDKNWEFGALFHDAIFKAQPEGVGRKWANDHFNGIMKDYDKCSSYKRFKIMTGLLLGSKSSWEDNKKHLDNYRSYITLVKT